VLPHEGLERVRQPDALESGLDAEQRVPDRQVPADLVFDQLALDVELPLVDRARAGEAKAHAVVACKIVRMPKRRHPLQVVGRGNHCDLHRSSQGHRDHVPVEALPHPHAGVQALLHDVHEALVVDDLEVHARVLAQESGEKGLKHHGDRDPRRVHAQDAGGLSSKRVELLAGFNHLRHGRADARQVRLARLRQAHAARCPVQQPCAEPRLQLPDRLAQGGRRHLELGGRRGEAAVLRNFPEGDQAIELIQLHPGSLRF
jgi:hypothetical protein